jgi:hypothetical protein
LTKFSIKAICQQRFQEMARNVLNSRFSFARNTILVENMRLRSSPLLEAAKRCQQYYRETAKLKYEKNFVLLHLNFFKNIYDRKV